jgi:hypothetical protein
MEPDLRQACRERLLRLACGDAIGDIVEVKTRGTFKMIIDMVVLYRNHITSPVKRSRRLNISNKMTYDGPCIWMLYRKNVCNGFNKETI